ncbi:MAG: DUF3592 domain-containing protein [Spirochaetota bacterium]|nr:DUF3592 domain-containing protein [Spirochaetota bacterium]
MNETSLKPSVIEIVKVDNIARTGFYCQFFILGVLGIIAYQGFQYIDYNLSFIGIGIFFTILGIALIIYRYLAILKVFKTGIEVPGRVAGIFPRPGSVRMEFKYNYNDKEYISSNYFKSVSKASTYVIGRKICVLVDPNKPEKSVIKDFYFK